MRPPSFADVSPFVLALAIGCGAGDAPLPAGRAGSVGSGTGTGGSSVAGASGTAGTGATGHGGQPGGVAGTGGSAGTTGPSGGSAGTSAGGSGGSAGNGGAGRGGASAGGAGGSAGGAVDASTGVDASGGSGGARGSDASDGSGGSSSPIPSAGCAKMNPRPAGGKIIVANDHIYDFPASYDGTKPLPLLMGFHAASNPIDQIEGLTNNSDFASNYVRAFPKSAGAAWDYNTDLSAKVYKAYDDLTANYCIDTRRVFATGHSSGAQLIVQIMTHVDAAKHMGFRAIAPVAASDYGVIVAPIPVIYIQGKMDSVRSSDGHETVARFTKANTCSATTAPYSSVMTCTSSGMAVSPGCVSYESCSVPTVWCSHNDPAYSNTSHGWPCFATKAMYDFFASLP
jgi:polyhydroxybutyrate depolymerase